MAKHKEVVAVPQESLAQESQEVAKTDVSVVPVIAQEKEQENKEMLFFMSLGYTEQEALALPVKVKTNLLTMSVKTDTKKVSSDKTEQVVDSVTGDTANWYRLVNRLGEYNVFLLKYRISFLKLIQEKKPELVSPKAFALWICELLEIAYSDDYLIYKPKKQK